MTQRLQFELTFTLELEADDPDFSLREILRDNRPYVADSMFEALMTRMDEDEAADGG